jgi:hypothetical protein
LIITGSLYISIPHKGKGQKPEEPARVTRSKLTVGRDRRAIPHLKSEEFADLPTPTHRKPQSYPICQSPVHRNAYLKGMRGVLTSTTDEDEVFTRGDRYCNRGKGRESTESTARKTIMEGKSQVRSSRESEKPGRLEYPKRGKRPIALTSHCTKLEAGNAGALSISLPRLDTSPA